MLSLAAYRTIGYLLTPFFNRKVPPPRRGDLPRAELWLHAASVGEAQIAASIIRAFRQKRPKTSILLTLQTKTGLLKARELLGSEKVALSLAPWDLPAYARRAFQKVRPRVFALIETEIWPNLILEAQRQNTLLLTLNGRLSERAFRRYRLLRGLLKRLFRGFRALGVIGPLEARRFEALGAPKDRLHILGNAKYDLLYERKKQLSGKKDHSKLSSSQKILTFGSLRGGEEKEAVKAVSLLRKRFPEISFVLAPRHLERLKALGKELQKRKIPYTFWSRLPEDTAPVILLDAIGPLLEVYAHSYASFVGGSLVPRGGQNPFEPALFERPLLFGPHMENFPYEAEALQETVNGIVVKNGEEIFEKFSYWLENPSEAQRAGKLAHRALEKFLGASRRYASLLEEAFNHPPP